MHDRLVSRRIDVLHQCFLDYICTTIYLVDLRNVTTLRTSIKCICIVLSVNSRRPLVRFSARKVYTPQLNDVCYFRKIQILTCAPYKRRTGQYILIRVTVCVGPHFLRKLVLRFGKLKLERGDKNI